MESDSNGYRYVDLGLSVKWATCNVGATSPEEYGDYFAWGDTQDIYETNYIQNCPTYELDDSELQAQGYTDGAGNLTAQYDAATVNWGGTWRMPTKAEQSELLNKCTWHKGTRNGIDGYYVHGPSGDYIFLPAAFYYDGSESSWKVYDGVCGYYWNSTSPLLSEISFCLGFEDVNTPRIMSSFRYTGHSVRPVLD